MKHKRCISTAQTIIKIEDEYYGVLPTILGVDIGAILNKALGDVDPAVERSHMERSAVVVVSGMDEAAILLEELADRNGVVVVCVPQYEGGTAHFGLLLLLVLVRSRTTALSSRRVGRVGAHQ